MRAISPFCISCRTSERLVVGDPRAVVEAHIAIIAFSAVIVKMRLAKTTSPAFMSAARWCRLFCLTVRLRLDIVAHSHALRVLGSSWPTPFVDVFDFLAVKSDLSDRLWHEHYSGI